MMSPHINLLLGHTWDIVWSPHLKKDKVELEKNKKIRGLEYTLCEAMQKHLEFFRLETR